MQHGLEKNRLMQSDEWDDVPEKFVLGSFSVRSYEFPRAPYNARVGNSNTDVSRTLPILSL